MKFKQLLHHLGKLEKIILVFLLILLGFSGYRVGSAFYLENTEATFVEGGIYTEGAVGQVDTLNPLFVQQGSVEQDLVELIFSGLTKYNPETGQIEPDLAEFKKSEDGKTYDFILKDGVKWHDGQLLTADDVLFTFKGIIMNPDFKGTILKYNDYSGIDVTKKDDRTIQFTLKEPDAFFLAKTTVAILPQHLLASVPVSALETSPFNVTPVGTGPYRYISVANFPTYNEYGLEVFADYYGLKPHIQSIIYRVYRTFEELKKNQSTLNGIRNIPQEELEAFQTNDRYVLNAYQLPQYVAVFINNEAQQTKETNVRLALQLGTDKQAIIDAVGQSRIIDTPLMEIDQKNWTNQYSVKKANGALRETEWQIPNKDALEQSGQDLSEVRNASSPTAQVSYITSPNGGKDWKTSREPITISGKVPEGTQKIWVNDYELQQFKPGDKQWSYAAAKKFDSLKAGSNVYEVYVEDKDGNKKLIDAITIEFEDETLVTDSEDKQRIAQENADAPILPTRVNKKNEELVLTLVTSESPAAYAQVAHLLEEQWKKMGVKLNIEVLDGVQFQERLAKRDYDLLLYGQNLGYNLDAYPYWHSSQAKKEDQESASGLNLSQFKNFVADTLLEQARVDSEKDRQETLKQIQEIIGQEVPAIFLYSPTYYTAFSRDVKYPEFKHLATTSDRLATIPSWYGEAKRHFKSGVNVFTFFDWAAKKL